MNERNRTISVPELIELVRTISSTSQPEVILTHFKAFVCQVSRKEEIEKELPPGWFCERFERIENEGIASVTLRKEENK